MSNDAVYAAGLLNRALDPATQPLEIQAFLQAEFDLLHDVIAERTRVIDVGCGMGRHLLALKELLRLGIGMDYERRYIAEARRLAPHGPLHFVVADATAIPLRMTLDFAMCLTNTWGTMANKAAVLGEMRRLAPTPHTRLLTVYSPSSVPARCEWYRRLGHTVTKETSEYLESGEAFRSEHFSEARLRQLIGECTLRELTSIAFAVTF